MIISNSTFRRILLIAFIKGLISFGQSSTYSATLDLDGTNSYIIIPSGISDLTFSSDKFTLEAWIKIENAPPSGSTSGNNSASNRDYIFTKKNDWSLYVVNINDALYLEGRFRRDYHGNWPDVRSSTTISADTWYHVAFTNSKSDGRIRIYVNGNLDNSENWTSGGYGLTSTTNPIGIGASIWDGIDNPSNFFDGEISDIRFWDSERTQSQINSNKNSTLSTSSNLKLYYKLNEGSGSTIHDMSGNSITGTASGNYQWKSTDISVTLTDTDSNNLVSGSNVVTITATFSDSMAATPTINITGEVSNALMTATSTDSVWIYPWTVSTTTSGIVSASVSGTNTSGIVYSGTDSITFTIDNTDPTVTLTDTDSDNLVSGSNVVTITATFSESMAATPTINITGEVSNAVMTASSTASLWIYPWTVSTTTSGIVSATISGVDLAGNVYVAGTQSITFTIDNSVPTVTLTDTDLDNLVSGSNVVTITATFSESMAATPTINITGELSNALMTASSTAAIWTYPWTVSTTTSGIVSATVSGSDLTGNAYVAGTQSITFIIDNIAPTVTLTDSDPDNFVSNSSVVTITATFSESMLSTPTISLTGIVSNAFMSNGSGVTLKNSPLWNSGEPNNSNSGTEAYGMLQFDGDLLNDTTPGHQTKYVLEVNSTTINSISGFTFLGAFNNHNYFYSNSSFTWQNANQNSLANGGYLAVINSNAELDFLNSFSYSGASLGVFLGFYQDINDPSYSEPDGGWKWVDDGLAWTYTWTVSGSTVTSTRAIVSGTDLSGKAYTGNDSITFTLDNSAPSLTIIKPVGTYSNQSVVVTLTYDEAVTGLTTDTNEFSEATNVASLTLISVSSDFKTYAIRINPNSDGLVKLTHAPNSPPVKDLAGNPISSVASCSFIYDITSPTLILTDTDSDNIVSGSNVVTITATFTESMAATPTINITGVVTNVIMTATSSSSVWVYPWTVSRTTSGVVSATVSGADLAGNAYISGTQSITFTIDNTLAQISSSGLTLDNLFLNITFNKDVYSDVINGLGSNTLEVSDFEFSLTSNSSLTLSSQNPESITQSGTNYILKIPATGYANGTEILLLNIPNNKIFDVTGNIFTSTLSFTLNNNLLVHYDFSNTNSYNGNTTSASNKSISNLSGNSNDGEIKGISNVYYDSFNDAIYFDGDSGGEKGIAISDLKYVSGDSDQINELTILSRIKLSSTTSNHNNDQRILFSFDRSSVFRFSVGSDQNSSSAGKLAFHFANSDKHSGSSNGSHDTYAVSQTIDLRDDNWHDVAVTFEANTPNGLKFYVDNNLVYSHPDSFKPISNQTDNETPRYGWVGNGSESSSAGSSTGPDHLFLGYVQSLKYYNKQLSQSFLNDIDRSGPNVQLSDTDADNLVSVSNVVTITALFSESLIADPTISITGTVTNVSMTSSSTANTWFYTWVVEESFDGTGYATVSGSDTSGNTYTGTDSITFKDLNPPRFSGTSVQNQNEYVDLSFDQPIYGNSNTITGLTSSSFTIVQTSGSSLTLNILGFRANNSSTFSSASRLSGGETTVRIFMDLSNLNPEGNETYSVSATNSSSIFDLNGNGMLTSQSASFTLNIPISGPVDPKKSTITLAPVDLIANSLNIATIIVQAKDSLGQNFNSGGYNVVIFNDSGDLKTIDNQNGTYSFNYTPEIPTSDSQDITFGFRVEGIIGDQTAKLTIHKDDDKDGVYNINDLCPGTDTDLVVNATGCALNQLDSDNDGVFDDVDACPDTPEFELNNVQGTPTFGEQIPTVVDQKGCGASQRDTDGDGIVDTEDNCIDTSNSDQLDIDDDGIGDVCDTDNPLPDIISTEIKFIQLPPNGSIVGKINATDPDGEALKFTQIGSNFTGVLSVATDGTVSVSSGPLLSFNSIYNGAILSFSVSDGENEVPGSVRILIEDAPRPPEISIVTLEISEDAEVGTIVGFVEAKDPMGGQIVSIYLQGDGFIELDSGVLKTTQELDYETTTAHPFTITAKASDRTDSPGLTGSKSESVRVADIPNMTYTGRFFISIFNVEDESIGAKVDFRRFYNPHNKNVGKWKIKKKIKGGADASKFTIKSGSTEVQQKSIFPPVVDENEDYLAFITPPDYENPGDANKDNIYEVEVEYINTDDGAPEVPIVVTQSIIQVPEGKVTTIELQSQPVLATDDNDGDGVVDILDNSPLVANPDQGDEDGDGVGDVTDDSDQDGVWNPFDICLNTPLGEIVDLDGCSLFYLPASNFSISKIEKCAGENSINLVVQDDTVAYKVNVNGATSVSESFTGSSWSLDKLSAGVYYVCISVEGVNPLEFERCFELTINESDPLQVNSFFNKLDQTVSFDLSGGTSYEVTHNGKTTQTTSNKHTVILDKGINNISISTGIECQGMFENTYLNSYEVKYAPNPFNEVLQLYFGGKDNLIEIGIYSTNGQLIDYQTISLPFGVRNYTLETNNYKQGVYIVKVRSETLDQSIQVIKE